MPEVRTIAWGPLGSVVSQVREWFDEPRAAVMFSVGAEGVHGANVRRITLQVMDRLRKPWPGRWLIDVYLTTTDGGDPGGAQTIAAVPSNGTIYQTVAANVAVRMLTTPSGAAQLDVAVAGSASRWMYALVTGGKPKSSGEITWA